MSAIINFSINLSDLPKDKLVKGKKGTYLNITASLNDETKYGNNVSMWVSQSKEERDAKAERNFIGNGKVVWTDGKISVAEKEEEKDVKNIKVNQPTVVDDDDDGLPF